MSASGIRQLPSSIRLSELSFPATGMLVARTRLAFLHLENLISFAKRDRDGKVDAYLVGYLHDELVLLFFRLGELVNAGRIGPDGRSAITISEALRRLRSDPERGQVCYARAPLEQLSWMYAACAGPTQPRYVDARRPEQLFPTLAAERFSGTIELIVRGQVSFLTFEHGRYSAGHLCGRAPGVQLAQFMESLFAPNPDGTPPPVAATIIQDMGELPTQAPLAQVRAYRELYRRLASAVAAEFPAEGHRKSERASTTVSSMNPVFLVLTSPNLDAEPDVPVSSEALTRSLADWMYRLLEDIEVVAPGSAPQLLRESTREQRYMLQAAGFYDRLPWRITW